LILPPPTAVAILSTAAIILSRDHGFSAMDQYQEKRVVLPIEVMIVVAINVVVVAFGYLAITTWGLFSN
jgi:hypothetical protein